MLQLSSNHFSLTNREGTSKAKSSVVTRSIQTLIFKPHRTKKKIIIFIAVVVSLLLFLGGGGVVIFVVVI